MCWKIKKNGTRRDSTTALSPYIWRSNKTQDVGRSRGQELIYLHLRDLSGGRKASVGVIHAGKIQIWVKAKR